MSRTMINPEALGAPRGYSNGVLLSGSATLFVAGQIGWDSEQRIVGPGLAEQFRRALENVAEVVTAAGGSVDRIGRLTIYVTDKQEYLDCLKDVGAAYRAVMGKHFPAMALVQVADLLEPGAKVEIEATAVF